METPERDRARTAGRERISKGQPTRRWGTRRISKGQATSRGGRGGSRRDTQQAAGDAADLEGTGRGGEQQGQSFGGPSASARKTEARPRQRAHRAGAWDGEESQHLGTSAATECGTPTRYSSPRNPQAQRSAPDTSARPPACEHRQRPPLPPNAPNGLERVTAAVAGIRTSPLRSAKPLGALGLPAPWHEGNPVKAPRPRPRISSPNAPNGLERVTAGIPATATGRRGKLRGARQLPAPWNERGLLRPHAHAADKQPQRAQRLGAGPGDGGRNRDVAPSRWARWGCLLPRISSPNAPNGLERVTGTVAGIVTSRQAVGRVGAAYWLARALANQSACAPAAADKQPQRAQRLGAGHRDGGRNRDVAPSRWARWGCLLPRISSPNAPNGLERVTGTVAGIVTSRQAVGRVGAAYWLARALANQSACAPAAADKQPQRAQRLGAGHRDGGRNRDVAPSRWARWGCLLVGTSAGKSECVRARSRG
uniref:Uncharacterized protein n=1 Tax=Populus alba TaxID=43335 RepID=A0A4U5QC36_POPAL|nr:hypothetical protein D5086_0000127830 [Populus alba]